jgi:hypothetical protein
LNGFLQLLTFLHGIPSLRQSFFIQNTPLFPLSPGNVFRADKFLPFPKISAHSNMLADISSVPTFLKKITDAPMDIDRLSLFIFFDLNWNRKFGSKDFSHLRV